MSNLVDISKEIVDSIDRNIKVLSIVGNRIYLCNTSYITKNKLIEDSNNNVYFVDDFVQDDWIEVTPQGNAPVFNDTIVIAPKITFLHGTPTSVNNEYLSIESRQIKKTPFIWLLETYSENTLEADSSIESSYSCRFFFMEGAIEEQTNDKHNDEAIKPMKALTDLFLNVIKNNYSFRRLNDITRVARPRFGVEVANKGSDRRILDDALSGYDLKMTLEVYNTTFCKNNC